MRKFFKEAAAVVFGGIIVWSIAFGIGSFVLEFLIQPKMPYAQGFYWGNLAAAFATGVLTTCAFVQAHAYLKVLATRQAKADAARPA